MAAVAVLGVSWAVQDGPSLLHQELNNCQIDVRPLEVEDEVMLESQVYFADWKGSGGKKFGTEFVIHVPNDSLLTLGDHQGEAPSSSGSVIDLDYGTYYYVHLYWDTDHTNAYIQVTESPTLAIGSAATVHPAKLTGYSGTFYSLGMMSDPVCEFVRNPGSDGQRLRITAVNYDIEIAFTLTDAGGA